MANKDEDPRAPDAHPFEDVQFWETKRQITHAEARESATRLINSHFRNEDRARVSIPANPDRDDDLIIQSYIRQQARAARDGSLIHRSALAEDTARAAEEMQKRCEGVARYEAQKARIAMSGGCDGASYLKAKNDVALSIAALIRALPLTKEAADANR